MIRGESHLHVHHGTLTRVPVRHLPIRLVVGGVWKGASRGLVPNDQINGRLKER
jgi:hypothetical protein